MQDSPAPATKSESSAPTSAPPTSAPQHDPAAIAAFIAEQRARQSLPMGFVAGLVAALLGAGVWAAVTVSTEYQIGWMAVGVGFLVGYAVRFAGKGVEPVFGYIGAVMALLGCVLGNLFSAVGFVAQQESVSFFALLGRLNPSTAIDLLKISFSPMDLLFYGIAVYEGYRFSFLPVSSAQPVTST